MKKLATVFALLLMSGGATSTPAFSEAEGKWQGYLVDRQCADSVKEDIAPIIYIQSHTKDCALMPNCRALGYSIYTPSGAKDHWLDLDKRGSELAINLLKTSKRNKAFYVEVTGTTQNKVLKTKTIKEIDEPKAK